MVILLLIFVNRKVEIMTGLRLDEESKNTILEISALSGFAQNIVKEILEYLVYSWAIKIIDNPNDFAELKVPYLGTIKVKYSGDKILDDELSTEVDVEVELSPGFRKMVGDLHDEGYSELVPLMQKKIEQAVMVASTAD